MGLALESRNEQKSGYSDVIEDIANTRLRAMSRLPFLFSELAGLDILVTTSIETAGITLDYKRLAINPDFWRNLMKRGIDDKLGLLLHEALHKMLRHSERSEGKDLRLWNIVCDAIVNKVIAAKFGLSNYVVENGITVEKIYEAIKQEFGDAVLRTISLEGMKKMNEEELYYLLVSLVNKSKRFGDKLDECKGVVGDDVGIPEGVAESGKVGEVKPLARTTDKGVTETVYKISEELKRGAHPGTAPGTVEEIISSLMPRSKVDWRVLLSQILARESGRTIVQTWRRPSRRYADLPGVKRLGPKPLRSLFLIDVSGSIDSNTLKRFIEETMGAIKDVGLDPSLCQIVFWDVGVRDVVDLVRVMAAGEVKVTGRGGTIIDDALKYSIKEKPDAVVVLTDGLIMTTNETKKLADELRNAARVSIFVYTAVAPDAFNEWMKIKYTP